MVITQNYRYNTAYYVVLLQKPQKQPLEIFFQRNYSQKSFTNFKGKDLYWSLFSIKLQAWGHAAFFGPEAFLKPLVFSCETCEIYNNFPTAHIWTPASAFLKDWLREEKGKAYVISLEFCKICQNTNFEECLWTAAARKRFCGRVAL